MHNIRLNTILNNFIPPLHSNDTVKDALDIMQTNAISSVVAVDKKGKPIGIFTEHDALKIIAKKKAKKTTLESVMSKNVFYVKEDMFIHDAYVSMEQKNLKHIIVVDENDIYLGVVTEGDFLRNIGFEEMSAFKQIKDAMSTSLLTVTQETPLTKIATFMNDKKSDYAIVVKDNIPLFVVGERDLAYYYTNNDNTKDATVANITNISIHIVQKTSSLKEAYSLMKEHNIHQLVVVYDDNTLAGLITRHDVLKAIHSSYFELLLRTIDTKSKREEQLLKHKEELEKLANYDQLTGLPNRLLFKTYLNKSISRAVRNNHLAALVILDLDKFNDINDSYGHAIGDELLNIISKKLTEIVREKDIVTRLSGDQFGIILENISHRKDTEEITNNILHHIASPSHLSNGVEVHIRASAGVVITPHDAVNVDEVFQYADNALNRAKNAGRSIYKFYTSQMTKDSLKKIDCESRLRNSVKANQLELYYQPQIHMKTGKILGAEALIRWNCPVKGLVSPIDFIPIAEESGLINEIGEWVINEACRQGKDWLDKGYRLNIAVNISANQIKYQDLPNVVDEALSKHNFTANKLELEITESSIMQKSTEVMETLHALRAKGIRLAIDDFGTGYSSLAYLKKFPIDVLKIDKSFVDDLPYSRDDAAIAIAIIEMGKALGYDVLAEGAETKEQVDFLRENGCKFFQGFYKSKPLPAKEFEDLLFYEKD